MSKYPSACATHLATLQVDHLAAGQDDGQRANPVPGGAVLEGGGSGGIGGHHAADGGAHIGRDRRVADAFRRQHHVELGEAHARLDSDRIGCDPLHTLHPRRAQNQIAHRRRAAGQRRLRPDRQDRRCESERCGNFRLGFRGHQRLGVAAGKVSGVLKMRAEDVRVALDAQVAGLTPRRTGPDEWIRHQGWRRSPNQPAVRLLSVRAAADPASDTELLFHPATGKRKQRYVSIATAQHEGERGQ